MALPPIFDLFFGYYRVELPYFLFLNMKQQTWKNIFPTFFPKTFRFLVPRGTRTGTPRGKNYQNDFFGSNFFSNRFFGLKQED